MRDYAEKAGWSGKKNSLDNLINQFGSENALSGDTVELLRFIAKPKRDYIEHGRDIPVSVAKLVLATILDLLIRLAGELDA